MKSKTLQNSTKKKAIPRYVWVEEYLDMYTLKKHPVSEDLLKRLTQDLVNWATNDEEALKISQFYLKKGIPQVTWNRWVEKYDFFKDAHNHALMVIGNRREMGAFKKKYSESMAMFTMPQYDQEWKANVEWRAKLKELEASNETKIVVIEKVPNSDIVPEKK